MFTQRWSRTGKPIRPGRRGRTRLAIEVLEGRILLTGDMVLRWNEAMIAAVRTAGQSPPVGARSAAIVQAAVYEAVNSIDGSYRHYLVDIPVPAWASKEAAAAEAAHDALVGLFPSQAPVLDLELLASLQGIQAGDAKTWGISVGHAAAQIMLAVRAHDGSDRVVTYTPGTEPGDWQPTPPAYGPPAVPQWPGVTPFALQSGSQFRPPPPPALSSPEYLAARDQVMSLGAVGSTTRTADQTEAALFWQGVVTPNSAPFWWNEIAQHLAVAQANTLVDNARLFALLDLASADSLIACYDGKYAYNFWRPVTSIRDEVDPNWTPLLATPSHPSYPSAHSTFFTASAVVLASVFGTDNIPFSFAWDGLPGVTRSFDSFSAASQECGLARIWAGFHYSFDVSAGETLGQAVGNYVVQNFLLPVGGSGAGGSSPSTPRAAVPSKAPATVPAPAGRSVASLVGSPADARFLVNGAADGSGDRGQCATPWLDSSPTWGDRGGLNDVASGSQREFANTSDLGAFGGHLGRAHLPGSGKSVDHGFRSLAAAEGGEDFWSIGGLPEV
jgi:membrane-associated phospholipid phosphatase